MTPSPPTRHDRELRLMRVCPAVSALAQAQGPWEKETLVKKVRIMPDAIAIVVSIVLMAFTIIVSAGVVLRVHPLPYAQALLIATVANLAGKLLVSVLHWPGAVSYSLPTLAFLILSAVFFRPSPVKLIYYWLFGFAMYLAIHLLITSLFGWTFMFPFWTPRLLR